MPRIAITIGWLLGLAVLLGTEDRSAASYVLLGSALLVALHGYFRSPP